MLVPTLVLVGCGASGSATTAATTSTTPESEPVEVPPTTVASPPSAPVVGVPPGALSGLRDGAEQRLLIVLRPGATSIGVSETGFLLVGPTPRGRPLLRVERGDDVQIEATGTDVLEIDGRPVTARAPVVVGNELRIGGWTFRAEPAPPPLAEAHLRVTGLAAQGAAPTMEFTKIVGSRAPQVMGSGPGADIRVLAGARPMHARFYFEGSVFRVAGIDGPVRVNEADVPDANLAEGDVVEAGDARARVRLIVTN